MNKDMPAFPQTNDRVIASRSIAESQGMTLRDYFAAKAMAAHIERDDVFDAMSQDKVTAQEICAGCYAWADNMLKAREA